MVWRCLQNIDTPWLLLGGLVSGNEGFKSPSVH
jgi:hypothetical protein